MSSSATSPDDRSPARKKAWSAKLALFLAALFVFIYTFPGVCDALDRERAVAWLVGEDGIYESAGAWSAIGAGIIFLFTFFQAGGKAVGDRRRNPWIFLLGLGCIFLGGEELSWGQRLFRISVGNWIYQWNPGGELALHNPENIHPIVINAPLIGALVAYLMLVPWLSKVRAISRLFRKLRLPIPRAELAFAMAALVLIVATRLGALSSGQFNGEQLEVVLQAALFVCAIQLRQDLRETATVGRKWAMPVCLAAVLLPLSFATLLNWYEFRSPEISYHRTLGLESLAAGKADEALIHFKKAIAVEPEVSCLTHLAGLQFERGNNAAAARALAHAIALQPSYVPAIQLQAEVAIQAEQTDQAEALLRNGLALTSNSWELQLQLAGLLSAQARDSEAIVLLDAYLRHAGKTELARGLLARIKADQHKIRDVVRIYAQAVFEDPEDTASSTSFAEAACEYGMTDFALAVVNDLAAQGRSVDQLVRKLIQQLLSRDQTQLAFRVYQDHVAKLSDAASLGLQIYSTQMRLNRVEEAIETAEYTLTVVPQATAMRITHAARLLESGNFQRAEAVLLKGLERQPENVDMNFLLAAVYLQQNQVPAATKYLRKVLAIEPGHPRATELLRATQANAMPAR